MQTTDRFGEEKLIPKVTAEEIQAAFDDPDILTIAIHKPGSRVTTKRGKIYIVTEDGKFRERTEQEKFSDEMEKLPIPEAPNPFRDRSGPHDRGKRRR